MTTREEIKQCGECKMDNVVRRIKHCTRCDVEVKDFHVDWTTWGRGYSGDIELCDDCGKRLVEFVERFMAGEEVLLPTDEERRREAEILRRRLDALADA